MAIDEEDERLKQRFLQGAADSAALNRLFTDLHARYFHRVEAFVGQALRGRPDVSREITFDSFVKLWKYRESYRGDSALFTYLCRIAMNLALDHIRREQGSPETLEADDPEAEAAPTVSTADRASHALWLTDGDGQARGIDEARVADCVKRQLDRMASSHPERVAAVRMQYFAGLKGPEIAEALGRTEGATREFLRQARIALRQALADCWKMHRGAI